MHSDWHHTRHYAHTLLLLLRTLIAVSFSIKFKMCVWAYVCLLDFFAVIAIIIKHCKRHHRFHNDHIEKCSSIFYWICLLFFPGVSLCAAIEQLTKWNKDTIEMRSNKRRRQLLFYIQIMVGCIAQRQLRPIPLFEIKFKPCGSA